MNQAKDKSNGQIRSNNKSKNSKSRHKSKTKSKIDINKILKTQKSQENIHINDMQANGGTGNRYNNSEVNAKQDLIDSRNTYKLQNSRSLQKSNNKLSKLQTNTNQSRGEGSKLSLKSSNNVSKLNARFKTEHKSSELIKSQQRNGLVKRQSFINKRLKTDLTDRVESPILIQQRFEDDHHNTQSLAQLLQFHTGYNQIDEQQFNNRVKRQKQAMKPQRVHNQRQQKLYFQKSQRLLSRKNQKQETGSQIQSVEWKKHKQNKHEDQQKDEQIQKQKEQNGDQQEQNQKQSQLNIDIDDRNQNQQQQANAVDQNQQGDDNKNQRQSKQSKQQKSKQNYEKSELSSHRSKKQGAKSSRSKGSKVSIASNNLQSQGNSQTYSGYVLGNAYQNENQTKSKNKKYDFTKKPIIRSYSHEQKMKIINQAKYIPKTQQQLRMQMRYRAAQMKTLQQIRQKQQMKKFMQQYNNNKRLVLQQSSRKYEINKLMHSMKTISIYQKVSNQSLQLSTGIKKSLSLPKIKPITQFVLPEPQQFINQKLTSQTTNITQLQSQSQINTQKSKKRLSQVQQSLSMSRFHNIKKQQILKKNKNRQTLLTQNNIDNVEYIQSVLRSKGVQFDPNAVRKGLTTLRTMPDVDTNLKFEYPKNLFSNPKYQKYPL